MSCPHRPEDIVHEEKAQLDFTRDMTYGDYLHPAVSYTHLTLPTKA